MSFQGKYQILSALRDGETQSFRARQVSSGRPVIVHHLAVGPTPSQQPDLASLVFRFLRCASKEDSQHLLDMGQEEGRIFVVTADVPECLDLRQWLLAGSHAHGEEEEAAPPVPEGTADAVSVLFTRAYTREAFRHLLPSASSAPAPPAPTPPATPPAAVSKKGPSVSAPPPQIPAPLSDVKTDSGSMDFTSFWEKSSQANLRGHPAPVPLPPPLPKSPDSPFEVPEVTAEFLSKRPSSHVQDAPTEAMPTQQAKVAAELQRSAGIKAGAPPVKSNARQFADLLLMPPEPMKPPGAASVGEVSISPPPPSSKPAAIAPETLTPRAVGEYLVETAIGPLPSAVAGPASGTEAKQTVEEKSGEKTPRRPVPMGFEVVFQSSKPRSRPTASGGAPDQSGIMAAPALPAPPAAPTAPNEPMPLSVAAGPSPFVPPDPSPPGAMIGSLPPTGFPPVPKERKKAVGAILEPPARPLPPFAMPSIRESEQATRLVTAPAMPPAKATVPAPPDDYAPTKVVTPPVPVPIPAPPNRAQPGEYTRMTKDIKSVAGPLPPEVPSSAFPPRANSPVSVPPPPTTSYLSLPTSQPAPYPEPPPRFEPSPYVAKEAPAIPHRKRRKAWAPILILSSLFLMTVAMLLFFAFKH